MLQIYKFFLASQDPARKNHLKGGPNMADAVIPSKSDLLAFTGDYSNGTQRVRWLYSPLGESFGNYFITLVTVWLPSLIVVTTMLTPCQGSLALMPAALR